MTPNTIATQTAKTTGTARVEQLLRDAAFVLKMTRRVKQEILNDMAGVKDAARIADSPTARLGV